MEDFIKYYNVNEIPWNGLDYSMRIQYIDWLSKQGTPKSLIYIGYLSGSYEKSKEFYQKAFDMSNGQDLSAIYCLLVRTDLFPEWSSSFIHESIKQLEKIKPNWCKLFMLYEVAWKRFLEKEEYYLYMLYFIKHLAILNAPYRSKTVSFEIVTFLRYCNTYKSIFAQICHELPDQIMLIHEFKLLYNLFIENEKLRAENQELALYPGGRDYLTAMASFESLQNKD